MVEDPHVCEGFLLISGLLLLTVDKLIHTVVTNISYKVILLYNTFTYTGYPVFSIIFIVKSVSGILKRCFARMKNHNIHDIKYHNR